MRSRRGLFLLALPLAALAALSAALAGRSARDLPAAPRMPSPAKAPAPPVRPAEPPPARVASLRPPTPAAADVIASAGEEARLRGTYQNFRTAVATGNGVMQDALARAIGAQREAAIRLAQEDVAKARNERDRRIALRTLDALRRQR